MKRLCFTLYFRGLLVLAMAFVFGGLSLPTPSFAADAGVTANTQVLLDYGASGYRYSYDDPSTQRTEPNRDFQQPGFDDSAWQTGSAAFGSGGDCPLQANHHTNWPVLNELFVRRQITIPAGLTRLRVMAEIDNDAIIYFDGTPLGPQISHENCPVVDEFRFDYTGALTPGPHTIAAYVKDRGVMSFFDMRVLADTAINFSFSIGTTTLCAGGVTSVAPLAPPDPTDSSAPSAPSDPNTPADLPDGFGTDVNQANASSNPHQTAIDVTVKQGDGSLLRNTSVTLWVETTLPGSSLPLTSHSPDADLRASLSAVNVTPDTDGNIIVTTDNQGVAYAILTSSEQIDATCVVKAKIGNDENQSDAVTMNDATGDMSVDDATLPADGHSTTTVYRTLDFHGDPVYGHIVRFYIAAVSDAHNNPVQPNDPRYSQYGSITTTQAESDADGITTATFTAGTLPGTITYGSEDVSVVANDRVTSRQPFVAKAEHRPRFFTVSYSPSNRFAQATRPRDGSKKTVLGGRSSRKTAWVSVNFIKYTTNSTETSVHANGPTTPWATDPGRAIAKMNSIWSPCGIQFSWKQKRTGKVFNYHVATTERAGSGKVWGDELK